MLVIADSISDSWIEMGQEWCFSESGQNYEKMPCREVAWLVPCDKMRSNGAAGSRRTADACHSISQHIFWIFKEC